MSENERSAKNRVIAEWFGWHEYFGWWCVPNGERQPHLATGWASTEEGTQPYGMSDSGFMSNGHLGVFDPWESEDASALILDRLIAIDRLDKNRSLVLPVFMDLCLRGSTDDRKTAIAEAGYAVAMAERAGGEK